MNITILELQSMTDKQVFGFATKLRSQCLDRSRLETRLGGADDLIQLLAITLFQFKCGAIELRPGCRLISACFGIVRSSCKSNWMSDRAAAYQNIDIEDEDLHASLDEVGDEVAEVARPYEEEGWEHRTLDEIEGLSALDKLLIQHDTLEAGARQGMTKDLASLFGCDERTIRLRRKSLREELTKKFNLAADFFCKKTILRTAQSD